MNDMVKKFKINRALQVPVVNSRTLKSEVLSGEHDNSRIKSTQPEIKNTAKPTEVDRLIANMPTITNSAGYPLLSKLFEKWLNPTRVPNQVQIIDWRLIEEADDIGFLHSHMQVARAAFDFSLRSKLGKDKPNFSGVKKDVVQEITKRLNGFAQSSSDSEQEFTVLIYEIPIDTKNPHLNSNLMAHLKATRGELHNDEDIRAYNRVNDLNWRKNDPVNINVIRRLSIQNWKVVVKISELFAGLGRFNLFLSAKIKIKKINKRKVQWSVDSIIFHIEDGFNFKGSQSLGTWSVNGLSYGVGTISLNNKMLNKYGNTNNLSDFSLRSEKKEPFFSQYFIHSLPRPSKGYSE